MAISNTTLIIVGSIAIFLFLVLLAHLIFKANKIWKGNRSRTGYRLLTRKYRKQKKSPAPSRFVLPKFSVSFPTSPLHVQLEEKGAGSASSHSGTEDSSGKRKDKKILKLQQRRRRYGVQEQDDLPSLKEIEARRKRRVFSESDIFMLTNPLTVEAPDKKRTRAKSEQVEMHRQRRMTLQPTLPVVSEASGHIECYFFYESEKKSLEIKVLQIFDIDEISPEIFRDRFALYDIGELPRKLKEPCLVRLKSDVVIFSDPSQLGMCVEITTFPRKRHIGTTELKYGLTSQTFEESFRLENRSLEQLHGKVVRLQVLLNYGKQPQIPVIIGEAIASLKHLKTDLVSPFRDCLVLPTDEKELEALQAEHASLGKLAVSVRYQLLRQRLTVRVVDAHDLPKFGLQQPSTSVKIGVYFCEFRLFKKTTDILKRTTNPQFNQSFDFDVATDRLGQLGILLEVQNHGTMHRNILGYVHIGAAAEGPGYDYWNEVMTFSDYNTECMIDIKHKKPPKIC